MSDVATLLANFITAEAGCSRTTTTHFIDFTDEQLYLDAWKQYISPNFGEEDLLSFTEGVDFYTTALDNL